MARKWTAAERKAASVKAKARIASAQLAATAPVEPPPGTSSEFVEEVLQAAHIPAMPRPQASISAVSGRQAFFERTRGARVATTENAEDLEVRGENGGVPNGIKRSHVAPGTVTVRHETSEKVRMWKRGPYGWTPRDVPASSVGNNFQNGWMEYCPDCGGNECNEDPRSCPAKVGRKYITCPIIGFKGEPCGKHIFATGMGLSAIPEVSDDPNELKNLYGVIDAESELKSKMDAHLMTWHRDEARVLGLFGNQAAPPRMGMEVVMAPGREPVPA